MIESFFWMEKTLKDAGLLEIKDALLTKGIQQENPDVRNAALETLGIYCLLNKVRSEN